MHWDSRFARESGLLTQYLLIMRHGHHQMAEVLRRMAREHARQAAHLHAQKADI